MWSPMTEGVQVLLNYRLVEQDTCMRGPSLWITSTPTVLDPVVSVSDPMPEVKVRVDRCCCVCHENTSDHLIFPCRHQGFCKPCLDLIDTCPVCRSQIDAVVQIFECGHIPTTEWIPPPRVRMHNSAGGVEPATDEVRAWGRVLVGEYVRYPHPTDRVVRLKICELCYKSGRIMQQADGIPITKRE